MIFDNFTSIVFTALSMKPDHRFKSWVKVITQIDPKGTNGFAFGGEFVPPGTVELEMNQDRLLLVAVQTGSRANHSYTYKFAILRQDGQIEDTGIKTSDTQKGWALTVRDRAIAVLNTLAKPAQQPDPPVQVNPTPDGPALLALTDDVITLLVTLKQRLENMTSEEIMVYALERLERATRPTHAGK